MLLQLEKENFDQNLFEEKCEKICSLFIKNTAPKSINIPGPVRNKVVKIISTGSGNIQRDVFLDCKFHVVNILISMIPDFEVFEKNNLEKENGNLVTVGEEKALLRKSISHDVLVVETNLKIPKSKPHKGTSFSKNNKGKKLSHSRTIKEEIPPLSTVSRTTSKLKTPQSFRQKEKKT